MTALEFGMSDDEKIEALQLHRYQLVLHFSDRLTATRERTVLLVPSFNRVTLRAPI